MKEWDEVGGCEDFTYTMVGQGGKGAKGTFAAQLFFVRIIEVYIPLYGVSTTGFCDMCCFLGW